MLVIPPVTTYRHPYLAKLQTSVGSARFLFIGSKRNGYTVPDNGGTPSFPTFFYPQQSGIYLTRAMSALPASYRRIEKFCLRLGSDFP